MGVNKKLKKEDIRQFVTEDLVAKVNSEKEELKRLKFNHAVTTLSNPASIRATRRDVARLATELNKRKRENKA
ncbi:MAG: 50S ribosomal protein L29 [Chitinophagales bacterium]|nr:50S ribosomal protein L29 [Chitinophagales bacterium]